MKRLILKKEVKSLNNKRPYHTEENNQVRNSKSEDKSVIQEPVINYYTVKQIKFLNSYPKSLSNAIKTKSYMGVII